MRYVLLLCLVLLFVVSCRDVSLDSPSMCFDGGECVALEIADTPALRQQGLMFRESLDGGMLFIFDEPGYYPFWMKNTYIPLDILWLDSSFTVVEIVAATPCVSDPCPNYGGTAFASYVLEVPLGFAAAHNLSIGSSLSYYP